MAKEQMLTNNNWVDSPPSSRSPLLCELVECNSSISFGDKKNGDLYLRIVKHNKNMSVFIDLYLIVIRVTSLVTLSISS